VRQLVKADLRVWHVGCLMTSLAGEAYAMQVSADEGADLVMMHGPAAEVERFVRHIEADRIEPFDVMERTPTSVLLRTRNPPVGVIPTILAAGCTILWPALYRDNCEHYTVLAPSEARLKALVRRLGAFGKVELERASPVEAETVGASVAVADLTVGLTPRQLDAVQWAVREGYYDMPRRAGSREIAPRMGIGRSTFEEHLRKGEQHLMRRFAGILQTHASLAGAARKGRGRPKG
jgi:predicted DNA binding protein